ncbi:FecR family protein [Pedobacter alluvionis]|uniref:FecR family protein n=1 Tax=Pedobacter alluvionis TaxID=475253 RepID=A0A497YJ72_9SPHI|nr:FecR family protein [Pedobacter alluvionis]RLJ80250.1 FecR family protein [Pedobacter alluvionis]TFB31529.1 FecR family protein [Pedobacter alluvionis]
MDKNLSPFTPDWNQLLDKLEADEQSSNSLSADEQVLLAELRAIRDESADALKTYSTFNTDKKWEELKVQIDVTSAVRSRGKLRKLWISIAAAAVLLVIGGSLIYHSNQPQPQNIVNIIRNDIAPGKNTATLTLDNGKKIVLSAANEGKLASEAGIVISKTADGQVVYTVKDGKTAAGTHIHTLSTAMGETYRLRLPDQSEVWLNASSSIKFPASFASAKLREVELTGEAYFQIAKDKTHPFIVKTNLQEVQVLGTHFNINSYADHHTTVTTLLEGSVQVSNHAEQGKIIKPGEQSIVQDGQPIAVAPADIKNVMAWKNGYFRFRNESIKEVMAKIIRWYNIDVVYTGKVTDEKFNGNISRQKNISEVLTMLSYSNDVKFKVEGRRVTVIQ